MGLFWIVSVATLGEFDAKYTCRALEVIPLDLHTVLPSCDADEVTVLRILPVHVAALGVFDDSALQLPAVEGMSVLRVLDDDPVRTER